MDDALEAVERCFEKIAAEAPHMFPADKDLQSHVAQENWFEVMKRLRVIRDSVPDNQRHQLFLQGKDRHSKPCMAQEILLKIKFEYLRVVASKAERQIMDGLGVKEPA